MQDAILSTEAAKTFVGKYERLPYKGCSCLVVGEGQVKQAEDLLKDWLGAFEWDNYYPDGWIRDTHTDEDFYNGKFEIENLQEFIGKLIEEGVTIVDLYLGSHYERGES